MSDAPNEWSGDMLDDPQLVAAFAAQLRFLLRGNADWLAGIRRDAEAMWDANPPEGYGKFEAWWRRRWVKTPMAEIQEHLDKAAALTFALEARHRKGRHELPARKAERKAAKRQALPGESPGPALGSGGYGRRTASTSRPQARQGEPADFMDLVRDRRERS